MCPWCSRSGASTSWDLPRLATYRIISIAGFGRFTHKRENPVRLPAPLPNPGIQTRLHMPARGSIYGGRVIRTTIIKVGNRACRMK
nr:putative integron gene cassette protein [uncultured bacterium]